MGLIHDIPTCQMLIDTIMQEAEQIVQQRLAQFSRARSFHFDHLIKSHSLPNGFLYQSFNF